MSSEIMQWSLHLMEFTSNIYYMWRCYSRSECLIYEQLMNISWNWDLKLHVCMARPESDPHLTTGRLPYLYR